MSRADRVSLLVAKLKESGGSGGDVDTVPLSLDVERDHVRVKPKSVEDIVRCLKEVGATGCSVSVVGGDHSGYARSGDLVLEMSHFTSVQTVEEAAQSKAKAYGTTNPINPEADGMLLHVGAGVSLKYLSVEAAKRSLAVPLGTAPTVGLGLILQGGVGHLTRSLGLALDAIRAVQMVTAKAEVLNLSRDSALNEKKELFWAVLGCAPNFGVVTSVTLEAVPFRLCDSLKQIFNLPRENPALAYQSLEKYMSWSSELPVDCSADCCLYFEEGTPSTSADSNLSILMGVYTFDFECSKSGFLHLELSTSTTPSPSLLLKKSRDKQGAAELMDNEPYLCEQPEGIVYRGFLAKRSFFVRALFFEKGADISKEVVESMWSAPSKHCYFHFQHMGGVVSKRADSAFVARQAEWSLVISGVWSTDTESGDACRRWVMGVVNDLLPKAIGSYATDLGPEDEGLAKYSFGPHTPQLKELKKKWDPDNVFKHGFPLSTLPES